MILADYLCSTCGPFEATVASPSPDHVMCACGSLAPWMPAPLVHRMAVSTTRGKSEKPERPGWLDTRELGEGMPMSEWRAKRAKVTNEERHNLKKELD